MVMKLCTYKYVFSA